MLSEAARNPSLSVTPLITTAVSSLPAVRPGPITQSAARLRRIGAGAVCPNRETRARRVIYQFRLRLK